ncbi:MAG TPA: hypothetical protein DDZ80_22460 [Cyanobacteria bacterium UBA8803]|nr:hypothetical protein [Cyanobacteria bacterium UBA9273]HBL61090.1 hypothetical protein [Cyanobacteria bacterium UBA8803]
MTQHWIKFVYERNTYVVDLDRISTFACTRNGRLVFWLPDGRVQVVIHPKTNPEAHQQILDYVENITGESLGFQFRVNRP